MLAISELVQNALACFQTPSQTAKPSKPSLSCDQTHQTRKGRKQGPELECEVMKPALRVLLMEHSEQTRRKLTPTVKSKVFKRDIGFEQVDQRSPRDVSSSSSPSSSSSSTSPSSTSSSTSSSTVAVPSSTPIIAPSCLASNGTTYADAGGVQYTILCTYDTSVNTISASSSVGSFGDCAVLCDTTSGCTGLTWNGTFCSLKQSFGQYILGAVKA